MDKFVLMKKFLGIIGGMGPEASYYFYKKIIDSTKVTKDQDHLDMVIFNHASIPNRNDYLLNQSDVDPFPSLKEDIIKLDKLSASLILMTCNTAHYYHEELQKLTNVKILNIIETTTSYLKVNKVKKVLLLATTATIKLNLYQDALTKYNIKYEVLEDQDQEIIMDIIFNQVKLNKEINEEAFINIIEKYKGKNIDSVVMGCTELSVLKERLCLSDFYVDPLEVEIRNILNYFDKEIK